MAEKPPGHGIELKLTGLALSGEAYGETAKGVVYVDGGIPGERVRARLREEGEDGARADLLEVLEPSPHRVVPACPHAAECGGCSFQHIAYAEQLRLKTAWVEGLLADALGRSAPRIEPMIGMPADEGGVPRGFRQKASFAFTEDDRGRLQVGHFARRSHSVIPVTECLVHAERANEVAFVVRDALGHARIPIASERSGLLRHVVVRTTEDSSETVAVVVATEPHRALEPPLRAVMRSKQRPEGLLLNIHDRESRYLFGPRTERIDGTGHVKETSLGPAFLSSPTGFFQTNIQGARVLLDLVTNAIGRTGALRVLDLYSGSGLFAIPLALAGHRVTAVEESRKASRESAKNAKLSNVPEARLRLTPSKVEDAIDHFVREEWDAAVIDPPRSGCPDDVMRTLAGKVAPPKLVIVSCNPEALANELRIAVDEGYRIARVQPVDMFPHTPHVETVAILERRPRVKRTDDAPRARPPVETPPPERVRRPRPPKPWDAMRKAKRKR